MEKLVSLAGVMAVIGTLAIFFVFFAVLGAWDINAPVRLIFSAMFAAFFGYLIFESGKKKTNE